MKTHVTVLILLMLFVGFPCADVHTQPKPAANRIELRVYPGADCSFTLYEDENDNYNYERGVCATIDFSWNNAARQLTIGERKGKFPGMLQKRTFNVVIVNPGNGIGIPTSVKTDRLVKYNGKAISVKL